MTDPARHKGLLLSFEGPEGSGKSTLISGLTVRLGEIGRDPVVLREPGGTVVGERIRDILLDPDLPELCAETELLLMVASRAQLVRQCILPALREGRIVICDRFAESSVAYQGGGRRLGKPRVDELNAFAVSGTIPALTMLCLLPPEVGRRRTSNRQQDRLELESPGFHQRVFDAYQAMAESGDHRYVVVDAAASPEEMLKQTLVYLRSLEHELLTGL